LAFLADLHRTAVGQLERGERTARADTVLKLCGSLGIEPSALFDGLSWTPAQYNRGELIIQLKFDRENRPIITGMQRVSSPGRRVYVGTQNVAPIRKGLGVNILSTPKGILVDREAQKAKVGGELLCSVW